MSVGSLKSGLSLVFFALKITLKCLKFKLEHTVYTAYYSEHAVQLEPVAEIANSSHF